MNHTPWVIWRIALYGIGDGCIARMTCLFSLDKSIVIWTPPFFLVRQKSTFPILSSSAQAGSTAVQWLYHLLKRWGSIEGMDALSQITITYTRNDNIEEKIIKTLSTKISICSHLLQVYVEGNCCVWFLWHFMQLSVRWRMWLMRFEESSGTLKVCTSVSFVSLSRQGVNMLVVRPEGTYWALPW